MSTNVTKSKRTVALTCLLFASMAISLSAQSVSNSSPYYDSSKEITARGTVSVVLARPSRGMVAGCHLLIITASGTVDASLGRWGLQGDSALQVRPGQQLELTGVLRLVGEREVLLARIVKVDGKVYTIRNAKGIPISPRSRERANQTEQGGE